MTAADRPENPTPEPEGASTLSITGTHPAGWREWVAPLWPGRRVVALNPRDIAPAAGDAPLPVFVEAPVRCLARALADGGEVAATLADWEHSARALLRRLQSDPANFVVMDLGEAMQAPDAVAQALRLALPAQGVPRSIEALKADPVWMALAAPIVAAHPSLLALSEELAVSCIVLSAAKAQPQPTGEDAVCAYRDVLEGAAEARARLEESQAAVSRHEARQTALEAELREQAAALQALTVAKQTELSALREECVRLDRAAAAQFELSRSQGDRLREELDEERARGGIVLRDFRELGEKLSAAQNLAEDRRREADLHLLRLHEAQAEVTRLGALVEQGQRELSVQREAQLGEQAERALVAEQLAASELQCRALMAESAAMQRLKTQGEQTEAGLRASWQRSESLVARLQRENDALTTALYDARAHGDLLLTQLHVQQASLQTAEAALAQPRLDAKGLAAGAIAICGKSEDGSHRHLDLQIDELRVGGSTVTGMPLRLVEHHGHPGLVLFRSPEQDGLLSNWKTTGSEDGRDYLLLVPQDQPARDFLLELGSSDWSHLVGVVDLLQRHLADRQDPSERAWARCASRLLHLLEALPARVRYDAIRAVTAAGEPITVQLAELSFGGRALGDAVLAAATDSDRLDWLLPDDACVVPSLAWPVTEQGEVLPAWRLPVGSVLPADAKRQAWAGLSPEDRDLLLGLLDALCGETTVASRATVWRDEARKILASIRKTNLARRLLRRIAKP